MVEELELLSPGRICLYGDHQDYLGLPVIAAAINKQMTFKAKRNNSKNFVITMPNIKQTRHIKLDESTPKNKRDYFVSSMNVLRRHGFDFQEGYSIEISGNIPIRAGASSSSAIVSGWIYLLTEIATKKQPSTLKDRAIWTYTAEVLEFNEPGGKMDQYTINNGNIVYINTVAEYDVEPLKSSMNGLILANSNVQKNTLDMLKRVRGMQEQAIAHVQKINPSFTIFDSKLSDIETYQSQIDESERPYFEAAVHNFHCTKMALLELKKDEPNKEKLAELMNQHHKLLNHNLKITIPIIDLIVEIALENGAKSAKINGSGGGGSVVIYAEEQCDRVLKALHDRGFEAHRISIDEGTRIIRKVTL